MRPMTHFYRWFDQIREPYRLLSFIGFVGLLNFLLIHPNSDAKLLWLGVVVGLILTRRRYLRS